MERKDELTREQTFFLKALSDYINEKETTVPDDTDISQLAKISDVQQLSPIIYYQTGIAELKQSFAGAHYCAVNRKRLLEQIDIKFRENEIKYLIFKGLETAQYYRHPQLRFFGDVDILVHLSDKEKAGRILESIGFEAPESKDKEHEWVYTKDSFEVELHHRLLYEEQLNNSRLIAFTDTVWEQATSADGICWHMKPEFHFVYLLLHLRKHFLLAGVGVRQFLDLAMMMKNAELDYRKIEKHIADCGIEKFSAICFSLIGRWLGIYCPIGVAPISDAFYRSSTSLILSNGVFGDRKRETLVNNYIALEIHKRGRLLSALAVIFPPQTQMKIKYPVMGQYKFLLPVLWLFRIVQSLFKRTAKKSMVYAGRHLKTGEREIARDELFDAWGL